MRIFNCIAFISLLSFFMECDDTRYYYLGGDLNYDQLEVNTTWIPSGKFVTNGRCHHSSPYYMRHQKLQLTNILSIAIKCMVSAQQI